MARTKKQRKKRKNKAKDRRRNLTVLPGGGGGRGMSGGGGGPRCGLCGKSGRLARTECCDQWICDDADQYVAFTYARNSCWRNHHHYTLCAMHHMEDHEGRWQECEECRATFDTETYVWFGTNEYNFEVLENPPEFEPRHCEGCGRRIVVAEGGYSQGPDGLLCTDCVLAKHPDLANLSLFSPEAESEPAPRKKRKKRSPAAKRRSQGLLFEDPKMDVEAAVLSVDTKTARLRPLGKDFDITLRAREIWRLVPGWIATIRPEKTWVFGGHDFVSGKILETRLDPAALGLEPLGITRIDDGPPPAFELERIAPRLEDAEDPLAEAAELLAEADEVNAMEVLQEILQADLRCLGALNGLGVAEATATFDYERAADLFAAGVALGDFALGADFEGVLPGTLPGNRAFLRCLLGLAMSLWAEELFEEAEIRFRRILALDPDDTLGVGRLLPDLRDRQPVSPWAIERYLVPEEL